MTLTERLDIYEKLMRLDKPIGILLLLWPALWGLWLARRGMPDPHILAIFLFGVVLMRSAGCVVNDYADRNFDAHVERTKNRPIAAGLVGPGEALALAAALLLLAFVLVLQLNRLTIMLSFVAVALAVIYPFLKRFFAFPQVWLGVAFGFAVPMAYAAQAGHVPAVAWALLAANTFWAIAYDTEYAMVDRDDDLKVGIHTSAITLGRHDVAAVMTSYVLMVGILAWIGVALRLGWPFHAGLVAASGMMFYHYTLIRGRSREGCFRAFRHNNWVGRAIFAGIALADVLPGIPSP